MAFVPSCKILHFLALNERDQSMAQSQQIQYLFGNNQCLNLNQYLRTTSIVCK